MLIKLLKYEIKAMGRKFLPLYGALLIVSIFFNVGIHLPNISLISELSAFFLVALFIALIVITLMTIIQRFKNNLLSNEGYLMFTLPVSTEQHILSKLITALFWSFLSCIVSALSFAITMLNADTISVFQELFVRYSYYIELIQKEHIVLSTLIIAVLVSQFIYFILVVYCALSISQMAVFTKRRGLISFASFIVIQVVLNVFVGHIFSGLFPSIPIYSIDALISIIATALIINLSLSVILFFAADYLLKKHLNLD